MRRLVFALSAFALLACVSKAGIPSIDVPPGLDARQVEFAILATLADQPPPEGLSPGVEITDRALEAWFGWRYKSMRGQRRAWFLESRAPGVVAAGFQAGKYYLRVGMQYDSREVRFVVQDSRNLRETSTLIHRTAARWIQNLEIDVRRSLGQLSVQRPTEAEGIP